MPSFATLQVKGVVMRSQRLFRTMSGETAMPVASSTS